MTSSRVEFLDRPSEHLPPTWPIQCSGYGVCERPTDVIFVALSGCGHRHPDRSPACGPCLVALAEPIWALTYRCECGHVNFVNTPLCAVVERANEGDLP